MKPGSDEAAKQGCTCARIDNHYGRGRYGDGEKYGWFTTGGCPIHDEGVDNQVSTSHPRAMPSRPSR